MISGMNSVRTQYRKDDIVNILKQNLANHKVEYVEAVKQYDIERIKRAAAVYDDLLAKKNPEIAFNFGLRPPENIASQYESLINVISMSSDEFISLNVNEANQIFNDEWDWALAAKTTNATYSNARR